MDDSFIKIGHWYFFLIFYCLECYTFIFETPWTVNKDMAVIWLISTLISQSREDLEGSVCIEKKKKKRLFQFLFMNNAKYWEHTIGNIQGTNHIVLVSDCPCCYSNYYFYISSRPTYVSWNSFYSWVSKELYAINFPTFGHVINGMAWHGMKILHIDHKKDPLHNKNMNTLRFPFQTYYIRNIAVIEFLFQEKKSILHDPGFRRMTYVYKITCCSCLSYRSLCVYKADPVVRVHPIIHCVYRDARPSTK